MSANDLATLSRAAPIVTTNLTEFTIISAPKNHDHVHKTLAPKQEMIIFMNLFAHVQLLLLCAPKKSSTYFKTTILIIRLKIAKQMFETQCQLQTALTAPKLQALCVVVYK